MPLSNFTGNNNNNNDNNNGSGSSPAGGGFGAVALPLGGDFIDPSDMLINYNEKFKAGTNILFRDNVIRQTISTLICKAKPNALLVGSAGVGKTKIVEDIANRLANNDILIPDKLKGYTIYELPIVNIVSGSMYTGQLEAKVQAVVDFIEDKKNKAILFIDEIHQICDDHNPTYEKIAQILKPALARGDFRCIGSTTLQESTTLFKDPAFNRRFTRVIVDELTQPQTVEILRHSLGSYLNHYNSCFTISDAALASIVPIADQYVSIGSHRPDNALTLFDRTIASEVIARKVKEADLRKKTADPDQNIAQAAATALQSLIANPTFAITENRIRNTAIKMMKGNSERDIVDYDMLRTALDPIKGQDDVIEKVLRIIKCNEKGLFPRKKPVTMLFTGTSGVGKTEITRIISENITGKPPIVLNMTEYCHSSAVNNIIGSNMGYVGSKSKIELPFDSLESNPYQFILLDEFEKGSKEVQRLFMRVFDEGVLKTNRGNTLDFSKAIIIATTNAAHKEVSKPLGFGELNRNAKTEVKELKAWFDTELINRFEHVINFHSINADIYVSILEDIYAREVARIRNTNRSITLRDDIEPDALAKMKNDFIPDLGARPAYRTIKEYIEEQVI